MNTIEDFIRAWDNVISPLKYIILRQAHGGIVASIEADDFTLDTDNQGKKFIKLSLQGEMTARISLRMITRIEGGIEE